MRLIRHRHQFAGFASQPACRRTVRPGSAVACLLGASWLAGQRADAAAVGRSRSGPAAVPTAAQLAALNAERGEIAKLSPEQLAGQRVIYSFNGQRAPAGLLNLIRHGDVGGVIFFSFNISSQAQLSGVISQMIAANNASSNPARRYPLLLMTDQEGGQVRRLPWAGPSASEAQIGASADPSAAAAKAAPRPPPGCARWA